MLTQKQTLDNYLHWIKEILDLIRKDDLVKRQPTKDKRVAARKRVKELENHLHRCEANLSEERLIARSKSWYRGVGDKELLDLVTAALCVHSSLGLEAEYGFAEG